MSQQEGKIIKYIMYFRDNGAAYKGGKEEEQREGEEEDFGRKQGERMRQLKTPPCFTFPCRGRKCSPDRRKPDGYRDSSKHRP